MPKKTQSLGQLKEAIARIKDIRAQDIGDNQKFTEEIGIMEKRLLDQFYDAATRSSGKSTVRKVSVKKERQSE